MKREREEEKHHHFNGIFSKRHQQPPPPPPPSHLRSSTVTRFLPTMEEEEEDNGHSSAHYSTTTKTPANRPLPTPSSTDGASIEIIRRPRGRPAGSKNKPKQLPVVTTESSEPSMKPCILEFPAGVDIIEATTRFCRKRKIGLCILSGNGVVTNVTLKQASSTQGSTVTFHGRFDILSISATILDSGTNVTGDGVFSLSLGVGPQGQVVGGVVIGPLVSEGTIYLVAGTFNSPTFFRLQHDEVLVDGGGESPAVVRGGVAEHNGVGSLYGFDRSIDGMWGPNTRHEHAYDINN